MTKTEALAMMMECFPASQVTAAMNATFLEACNRAPLEAVVKCCADFRHGKVERKRNEFIPSTAQFSRHLRTVENEQRFDRKRASNQRRIEAKPIKISDEECARRLKRIEQLKAQIAVDSKKMDQELQARQSGTIGSRYQDVDAMKCQLNQMKTTPIVVASKAPPENEINTIEPLKDEKQAVNQRN